MAGKKEQPVNRRMWMIDPIYRKFTAKAFENLTGTEFYNYFRTLLTNGEHEFQFSNRKLNMQVDERWVEIIEATIPAFIEITRNPRVIITQEELITNVVQAKKIDQQVVKHLCSHSYLVDAIDEEGNVVPNKVLNIFKEETWDTYENRFVYTLLKMTYDFITKRYMDMKEAMNDEFGATLLIKSTGATDMEDLNIDMKLKIKQKDDLFDKNAKHKNIFTRIEEIYEAMVNLMNTTFAKTMMKYLKVTPPLVPTNAIKKNPHLRKCHKLWDFLLAYFDVGYTIEIIEQNPEINEKFEQDIWDDIMFTYIILKGYLEDNRDRAMDREVKSQRRTLRPRYIKEIVEELVRNFNMNDVEVRKVLIEELTKEQLMREEQSERYRLVEEQRKAKEEEKHQKELEKIRQAKEAEKARRQAEKQKERERIQAEKEKARREEQRKKDAEKRAALDARRTELFTAELSAALGALDKRRIEEKARKNKVAEAARQQELLIARARKAVAALEKKTAAAATEENARALSEAQARLAMLERGERPVAQKKARKPATAGEAESAKAAGSVKAGEGTKAAGDGGRAMAGGAAAGSGSAAAGQTHKPADAGKPAEDNSGEAAKRGEAARTAAIIEAGRRMTENSEEDRSEEERRRQEGYVAQQRARMEQLRESLRNIDEERAAREAAAAAAAEQKALEDEIRREASLAAAERGEEFEELSPEQMQLEIEAAKRRRAAMAEMKASAEAAPEGADEDAAGSAGDGGAASGEENAEAATAAEAERSETVRNILEETEKATAPVSERNILKRLFKKK